MADEETLQGNDHLYPVASPPIAVASLILSMTLLSFGSGVMFTYIPLSLAEQGFPAWVAGAMLIGMSAGGVLGCFIAGPMIARAGHARVFMTCAAILLLGNLLIAIGVIPELWIASRTLYGISVTILFIVAQSWLNDSSPNEWRGKVIAFFYTSYVLGIGLGSYSVNFMELGGMVAPLAAVSLAALAIIPIGLTRLEQPPPPESMSIAIRSTWKISPVGMVGLLVVGGLSMLLQGFLPIYTAEIGYSKGDITLLMFLMQFGMLFVQFPLGALSDRIDRRYVLVLACAIVIVCAAFVSLLDFVPIFALILIAAVWSGATESIYAVSNAHANDRAEPQYYVSLNSTLLVAWSVSGTLFPILVTALTPILGAKSFIYVILGAAAFYCAFVVLRILQREAVDPEETEPYQAMSSQMPLSPELAVTPDLDYDEFDEGGDDEDTAQSS